MLGRAASRGWLAARVVSCRHTVATLEVGGACLQPADGELGEDSGEVHSLRLAALVPVQGVLQPEEHPARAPPGQGQHLHTFSDPVVLKSLVLPAIQG